MSDSAATTIDHLSPSFEAMTPAGRSKKTVAIPDMAVISAANPGVAPSSVARRAIIGTTAPKPMDTNRLGP